MPNFLGAELMSLRVCFATFEISPFTSGGIGTWLRNTLDAYSGRQTKLEVLYYGSSPIDTKAFVSRFPRVILHQVDVLSPGNGILAQEIADSAAEIDTISQRRAYVLAMFLKHLEQTTGPFDVIEFLDWGGPGFYAIQEKLLGTAFQATALAVRLHGSEGMLRSVEHRTWAFENLVLSDLERVALRYADIKIAHLDTTYDSFHSHYQFSDDWSKGRVVQLPPVHVRSRAQNTIQYDPALTPILFTSKFQSIKRPDLFVRGVAEFLRAHPDVTSPVMFCAFDADNSLRGQIDTMVGVDMRERVQFLATLSHDERELLIARAIAIFPNAYETFCYAAYEASESGAIVILNKSNPAFGESTPWVEGINCLKFDGTAHDLTRVLSKLRTDALLNRPHSLSPCRIDHAPTPYWETPQAWCTHRAIRPNSRQQSSVPTISIVVPCHDDGALLVHTVSLLLTEQEIALEIVVVDDGSQSLDTLHALEILEGLADDDHLRVLRHSSQGFAASLNACLPKIRGDVVGIMLPGTRYKAGTLRTAMNVFDRDEQCGAFVPASRAVEQMGSGALRSVFHPLAEAFATGLFVNRVCIGNLFCRRALLEQYKFDEVLPCEWTWDFVMRLSRDGHRIATSAEVMVDFEMNSVLKHVSKGEEQRRTACDLIRRNFAASGPGWRIPLTVIGDGEVTSQVFRGVSSQPVQENYSDELYELKNATSVKIALGLARRVQAISPKLQRKLREVLRGQS